MKILNLRSGDVAKETQDELTREVESCRVFRKYLLLLVMKLCIGSSIDVMVLPADDLLQHAVIVRRKPFRLFLVHIWYFVVWFFVYASSEKKLQYY